MKGVLNADLLQVANFSVDWLAETLSVKVRAALVDSKTGVTRAWMTGAGIVWSKRVSEALAELRAAIAEDLATAHMHGGVAYQEESRSGAPLIEGIAEHAGSVQDPPSV